MNLQQMMAQMMRNPAAAQQQMASMPLRDTAETVHISSLALLKMLKHGRAGVPMEVMGLMLGDFVDDYTIHVYDVFSMPQSGSGTSVEAVDDLFQQKMLDMLKRTGRPEMVVGWYHSHPGFGCWFSGVDINTQQSFERLNPRAIGVVVDPIQSVKGKVVIDCFRCIKEEVLMMGKEPRQSTAYVGHLKRPNFTARLVFLPVVMFSQALAHGLNVKYYSINVSYRKDELEEKMLQHMHSKSWGAPLGLKRFEKHREGVHSALKDMAKFSAALVHKVEAEEGKTTEESAIEAVGKLDPKVHLKQSAETLTEESILQSVGMMVDTMTF